MIGLALVAALVYWHWHRVDPARAFEVTLALLVISCPCALSLAIPAALSAAHSGLARIGVIAARPDALETLAAVTDVVFDKTGTLGSGAWEIASVTAVCRTARKPTAIALAAALERDVRHPLAGAFRSASPGPRGHVQSGCRPDKASKAWSMAGCCAWASRISPLAERDDGAVWLGDGSRRWRASNCASSRARTPRPRWPPSPAQGLRLHLLSGDSANAVQRFAHELGDPFESQCRPDCCRRTSSIACARCSRRDAWSPWSATASTMRRCWPAPTSRLRWREGAALAQQAADLVVVSPSLLRIADAARVARRTRSVIRQNLAWAIGYNLLALPLAAAGLVTPWVAALAMVLSSLTVTLNALRLVATART